MNREFIQMRSKLATAGYITLDKCGCSECTEDDACAEKVKRSVKVWPSARASQMVAKCRKAKGQVRKTEKGSSLKRWEKEKWVKTSTGEPCGGAKKGKGYCRPSKKVSKETPKTKGEMSESEMRKNRERKKKGQRAENTK